ncbi:hypothetical protein SLEP1_g55492 [Rubroshorea leprosula]|uniref:Uncharacterized protein n=1 Tax=Rubroshorea leprosula TaxID=152421 RepID=A0AAV5MGN7_9ROSI|nr:hypothetical protein SLEP1_g55492 [Rubroshorea leprosula]
MLLPSQQRISALMRRLLLCCNSRHPSPCDNVTGHVIALNLSCSFLSGTFPSNSTLFFLRNLQSLNLAVNDFRHSKIPSEISQFTRLKHLDVSYSLFSGQVPREIAHLPKLVSLNLSNFALILETTTFKNLVHNLSEVRELVLLGVNMTSVNPRLFMNLSSSLTTLDLWESVLGRNFPNSIFRFPNLKRFSLGGNRFSLSGKGNLTIDLPSSNWSSPLQHLYLSVMDCGRRLPESIGDLKSLQSLGLLDCNLEGSIPASIGSIVNLRQLTSLSLSSNNLNGQIPPSLANLTQLTFLDLSDNQFSGPIPFHASRHSNGLQSLVLSKNSIRGNIPEWICEKDDLEILDLSHNNLFGKIPNCLSKSLSVLNLRANYFDGNIPKWICEKDDLEILDLSHNNLMKEIPKCLPKSLRVLNLQANYFDGNIPFWFPEDCGLQNLNLHGNQMDGLLPRSLVNCSMLEVLDVGNNSIEDSFPHWLESLPHLQVLLLRSNKFHGSVQSTKESPSFPKLRVLDLSNNDFLGPLPLRSQFLSIFTGCDMEGIRV